MIKDLPVNSLDLAVGGVLLISALLAFIRGFVHEMLSIAAWAGALAAAVYGLPYARPFAHGLIPIGWAADAAAAVVIFLAVLLTLSILTHAAARTIQKSALNNLDRSLGFVFGLARAVVILGVGLIVVDWFYQPHPRPDWVRTAKTLPIIETAAGGIKQLVPSSFMAPKAAAKAPMRAIKAAADAKKTLDRLTTPAAAAGADTHAPGYENKERRDMEKLINSSEGAAPAAQATPEKPRE